MKNCKVLIPFVNSDGGIALNVNDIIELTEERAKELESKGLVGITANPLTFNESSDPQISDDGNIGESQTNNNNEDVSSVNNDGDSQTPDDENTGGLQTNNDNEDVPSINNDEDPQTPDDGNTVEPQTKKKSNKK